MAFMSGLLQTWIVLILLWSQNTGGQYPEYMGCFRDFGQRISFPKHVADCIYECHTRSFIYAGIRQSYTYWYNCNCGNTIENKVRNGCEYCENSKYFCGQYAYTGTYSVYKTECPLGRWGLEPVRTEHPFGKWYCAFTCGSCYDDASCNMTTGACPGLCMDGFEGPNCDHGITDPRYLGCYIDDEGKAFGSNDKWADKPEQDKTIDNCINICIVDGEKYAGVVNGKRCFCGNMYQKYGPGGNCDVPCEGNSSQICGALYRASVYKAECPSGYWGNNSTSVCSIPCGKCLNGYCESNGNCPAGSCHPGWRTEQCNQVCYHRNFGAGCNGYCHCYNNTNCDPVTGECLITKCDPGYQGSTCSEECPISKFGSGCEKDCHCKIMSECHHVTGHCNGQCEDGWEGESCQKQVCQPGTFGPPDCKGKCHCLSASNCYYKDGNCTGNCAQGWTGTTCQVCDTGLFGENCEKNCHCAPTNECNPKNGSCLGKCQDGWGGKTCQMMLKSNDTEGLVPVVAGVVAAVVVLIIVFVILLAVLLLRRKKAKGPSQEGIDYVAKDITDVPTVAVVPDPQSQMVIKAQEEKSESSMHSVESNIVIDVNEDEEQGQDMTYMNNQEVLLMTTVKLKDLQTIVNQEKVKQEPFKDEYGRLPKGKQAEWQAAIRTGLKDKNRFKNIYPYDHHAVKLSLEDGDPLSDYVNGSFVKDSNGENTVIASQGPTPESLPDFWRMIWEHDVNIIVMLTNLVEGGKIKCEQYWPDDGKIIKGKFNIELTQSLVLPDFVIRCMTIKKGGTSRNITQLHYTSWPDHGVPRVATALLNFRRKVMAEKKKFQTTGLTLIHCSAGIGRTGAYLAIDHLLRDTEEKEEVDVFNCVSNLRVYRVNMVQTRAQYAFVYTALLEGIWVGETLIPCFQFHDAYSTMLNPDPYSCSTKLEQQYQLLQSLKHNPNSSKYSVALSEKNRSKNRNQAIVPANAGYPTLMTRIKGRTEYINGVFVDGRGQRNRFLVTQMPLVDTVVDFWRMVYDYKSPTIIMLNKTEDKKHDIGIYWPVSESPVEHGPFTINLISETQEDGFLVREINIQLKETIRSIKQYFFDDWPLDGSIGPSSPENLFKMYEHIKISRSRSDLDGPLVVHCLDGVQLSGMYVAISNLCDMMSVEQELDVFHVVQTVRENRPQFITSQEQYRYLYEACGKYMDSYSTYANFQ